jgi:hypothetical protein
VLALPSASLRGFQPALKIRRRCYTLDLQKQRRTRIANMKHDRDAECGMANTLFR